MWWHDGLAQKVTQSFPYHAIGALRSYLSDRWLLCQTWICPVRNIPHSVWSPIGQCARSNSFMFYTQQIIPLGRHGNFSFCWWYRNCDLKPRRSGALPNQLRFSVGWFLNRDKKTRQTLQRIKADGEKPSHITFALRRGNSLPWPYKARNTEERVKDLGMNIKRRLTWRQH